MPDDGAIQNQKQFSRFRKCGPVVQTHLGPVQGIAPPGEVVFPSLVKFLGVPFAAPPTDELRFAQPTDPPKWEKPFIAHDRKSPCFQFKVVDGRVVLKPFANLGINTTFSIGSEDCLYVDVYVPGHCSEKSPCAVMQWIYGGGWMMGDKYEFGIYDASKFAQEKGVIVVAANYRIHAPGWLSLAEVEAEGGFLGNVGLADQTHALQWTQQNIAAFGGDPNRVTIFGESAGGLSVCQHLVSPMSNKLFSSAIMQSGACDTAMYYDSAEDSKAFGARYATAVGCGTDRLNCMRKRPIEKLVKSYLDYVMQWPFAESPSTDPASFVPKNERGGAIGQFMPFKAVIDGKRLPDVPLTLLKQGKINVSPTGQKLNVIMGNNLCEGCIDTLTVSSLDRGRVQTPLAQADYETFLSYMAEFEGWGADELAKINEAYPAEKYMTAWPGLNISGGLDARGVHNRRVADFFTHAQMGCSTRRALKALTQNGHSAYWYHYEYHAKAPLNVLTFACDANHILGMDYLGEGCKVSHGVELTTLFGTWQLPLPKVLAPEDAYVTDAMQTYWSNLAKYGSPNGHGSNGGPAPWPKYDPDTNPYMALDHPVGVHSGKEGDLMNCDFWDSLPA